MTGSDLHAGRAGSIARLADLRPLFVLPDDDLPGEVLIPAFRASERAACMMGFFSSASLTTLAPGLATFLNETEGKLRLIVSPFISEEDQVALAAGLTDASAVADRAIAEIVVTEDTLARHTLDCLAHLLRAGRVEIRIAVMRNALFHPKVWLFSDGAASLAVHGSSNMTSAGIAANFEQVSLAKGWIDATQRYVVDKLESQFERLWRDEDEHVSSSRPRRLCESASSPHARPTRRRKSPISRRYSSAHALRGEPRPRGSRPIALSTSPLGCATPTVRSRIRAKPSQHGSAQNIAASSRWRRGPARPSRP